MWVRHRRNERFDGSQEPPFQRLNGGLGAVAHTQLSEDAHQMVAHRVLADREGATDATVCLSSRHQGQHLALSRADEGCRGGRGSGRGQQGAQGATVFANVVQARPQIVDSEVWRKVDRTSAAERPCNQAKVARPPEQDDGKRRSGRVQRSAGGNGTFIRHLDHCCVQTKAFGSVPGRFWVGGCTHHLEHHRVVQPRAHPLAEHGVREQEQEAHCVGHGFLIPGGAPSDPAAPVAPRETAPSLDVAAAEGNAESGSNPPTVSRHLHLVDETSDQGLIEGCLRGDESCWEGIYRRYQGLVRRTVAWPRWKFTPAEIEDNVQEVFLELMRALPTFRGEAGLPTFLTRLAKNKCVSQIRRKTAQKRGREEVGYALEERKGAEDEPLALAVDKRPGPEEEVLSREEAAGVLVAMRALNPDCQSILELRYFRELSYDEICSSLGLPLGTVCSRLKRCLERLKKGLSA